MKKTNRPAAQFTKATHEEGAMREQPGRRFRLVGRFACPLCSEVLAELFLTDGHDAQADVIAAELPELMEMFKKWATGVEETVSDKRLAQMGLVALSMKSESSFPMAPQVQVSARFQRSTSEDRQGEFIRTPNQVPYSQTRMGKRRVSLLAHAAAKVAGPDAGEFAEKYKNRIESIKNNSEREASHTATKLHHSHFQKRGAVFHCCECTCEIAPHQVLKVTAKEWGKC